MFDRDLNALMYIKYLLNAKKRYLKVKEIDWQGR